LEKVKKNVTKLKFRELINAIAHEIKNPLSTIKMHLELIKEDMKNGLTPKEKVNFKRAEIAIKEVGRITNILNDFVRFTLLSKLDKKECDINIVLKDIANSLEVLAQDKEITIIRDFDTNLPQIKCDANLLKQAIYNIVLNAIEASGRNKAVIISTKVVEDKIVIKISDNGTGIEEKDHKNIFKPFFTTKQGGTGLGLAIAKRIVELHTGKISFESTPGKGTTFILEVPFA
jgi:signal transduction histidine kinase